MNKWLRQHRAQIQSRRPYFLYVHYLDPHAPYLPAEPWFGRFMTDGLGAGLPRHFVAAYDSEVRRVDQKIGRASCRERVYGTV